MTTRTIDDRDDAITYSPAVVGVKDSGWQQFGGPFEYMGTTMRSIVKGSTALLEFEGVGVTVRGTIPPSRDNNDPQVETSYSIDGGTPTTYTSPIALDGLYSHVFFRSPQLPNAKHTLSITNERTGGFFYLDCFEVIQLPPTGPDSPSSGPISTRVSTATPSESVSQTESSSFPAQSSSPAGTDLSYSISQVATLTSSFDGLSASSSALSSPEKRDRNVGAMVGGVLGGIAAIFILALFLLWKLRLRRQQSRMEKDDISGGEVVTPAQEIARPFLLSTMSSSTINVDNGTRLVTKGLDSPVPPPPPYYGPEDI